MAMLNRVRFEDDPPETKPRVARARFDDGLEDKARIAATALTPESLAYALPGGLAKLAVPRWIYAKHIQFIEDRVLRMAAGEPIRLAVSTPPRIGKTSYLSRVLPAWFLGRFPDKHVLHITNHTDLARKNGRYARNILKVHGKTVFGISVADDTAAAGSWAIEGHGGGMESVGTGATIQGLGADLLLGDDLIRGIEMASNTILLDDQWEWWGSDVISRLEPNASVILTFTRWSALDIIGHIEEEMKINPEFEKWEIVNLPALAEENDPLGREIGEAIFPERFKREYYLKLQNNMDAYWYEAMFNGRPSPSRGAIVNVDQLRRFDHFMNRGDADLCVVSADTASKENELADFTVFGIWLVKDNFFYLVDVIRERMRFPVLLETTKALHTRWMPDLFLIEDKGSGTSLIQQCRSDEPDINIVPIDPGQLSKIIRMENETVAIRTGQVLIPQEGLASWVGPFVEELRMFPKARKDQVDMLSQFLKFMRQQGRGVDMW